MLSTLLFFSQLYAAPVHLLAPIPESVLVNEAVEIRPIAGHHLSNEAPQSCGTGLLISRSPRALTCQFGVGGETKLTLNVCDDKKTFCRATEVKIRVAGGATSLNPKLQNNVSRNQELRKRLVEGFVEDTPEKIAARALAESRSVFVMISTDWCPPCNEAKEYLFKTPQFAQATKDFLKVYVDGDSFSAKQWGEVVPFHQYPSFALLNNKMQEIGRYDGELRTADFARWAMAQSRLRADPIRSVRTRVMERLSGQWLRKFYDLFGGVSAEGKAADRERVLEWAFAMDDRPLVDQISSLDEYPKLHSRILRFRFEEMVTKEQGGGGDFTNQKRTILEGLLAVGLSEDVWARDLKSICDMDKESCQAYLPLIKDRIEFLEKRSDLMPIERDSMMATEYYSIAETYAVIKQPSEAKRYAKLCLDRYTKLRTSSFLRAGRAGLQGMLYCNELLGDLKASESWLRKMVEDYPNEPTFFSRLARLEKERKNWNAALGWVKRAENQAYGYNWFSLQLLKIEILLGQKAWKDARIAVNQALEQVPLDQRLDSRHQRIVARLRKLEAKIQKSSN